MIHLCILFAAAKCSYAQELAKSHPYLKGTHPKHKSRGFTGNFVNAVRYKVMLTNERYEWRDLLSLAWLILATCH